ncbi:high-potential iron-sulfur protein [Undibacterium sp. TS12]|uniref:high-potential iron-sulfur protein n=1 Tax=Undibacterium sp. TS12 TaxID=2908202 RepID=UPI001F4C6415|nr:high-potential iron-sulfur protein [Undibacterium sp. TS12]MCH8618216.1 high-potential iron-sulfur protein [Undibacterium sp. TS12]
MKESRRIFFMQLLGASLAMHMGKAAEAADVPLKEDEPQAKQHAYTEDFKKVDVKRFPEFQDTQKCGSCQIYEDKGKGWGGCAIFPGKLVKETGWCDAWG